MKRWKNSNTLLILTVLFILFALSCNKDEGEMGIIVTVFDSSDQRVEGASVRVYCTEQPKCIIDNTKTTDAMGQTGHVFELEAILAIEVTKVISPDTLKGTGIADLVDGETLSIRVVIK